MYDSTAAPGRGDSLKSWQLRIFWLLWSAYASYYLCRVNFAVAQPAILLEFPSWTAARIGLIPSVYAAFYAIGQVINGALGERFGARRMMTAAMVTASATNIAFGMTSSYPVMLSLWAVNGFAQSAGWSLLIQTIANWNTSRRRGVLVGLISTCYQVGNVASWVLAGLLCDSLGWRYAFMVPGFILVPMAIVFAAGLRNRPEDAGFPPVRDDVDHHSHDGASAPAHLSTKDILVMTLSNTTLWILGLGFLCANSVRYTFMNWTVQYMADFQGQSIKGSAFTAVALPLIGSAGAVFAGWASDHLFGRRRAPVCAIMLFCLAAVCAAFVFIPAGSWVLAGAMFGVAGFLIYGPDMLMSGAATIDMSHPRAASVATGLTMSLGAAGAIFSGAGIGYLRDMTGGDWSLIFWVLSGLSLIPALLMVAIWNARPKGG